MALRDAFLPSPRRVLFSMGLPATIGDWAIDMLDAGLDRVGAGRTLLESVQIWKELAVDEVVEVVACQRSVMVERSVFALGRRPALPAILLVEDEAVLHALKLRHGRSLVLESVQILQEEQPGSLFGVVQLRRAAGLLAKNVVDVLERLLKQRLLLRLAFPVKMKTPRPRDSIAAR